ncbi:hypothetical protein SAMN02949497_0506 [Methylomagnum ishizawai]|uniref:Uncharacterized protein n=1 Tax=Methylomagnum ishizawai TaxID=1760988 RepID=A0A1Y6D491_9GAMM|nr:hypothetical protein [Methylomagnum ishizawai]SMF97477.1 hypothetical protein SAMN02949497_0506 [Methylomagnum ishizawai]
MAMDGKFDIGTPVVFAPDNPAKHPRFIGKDAVVVDYSGDRHGDLDVFIAVDGRIVLLVKEADLKPAARTRSYGPESWARRTQ